MARRLVVGALVVSLVLGSMRVADAASHLPPAGPPAPLSRIPADVAAPPRVSADAAVLIDYATGRILWAKDAMSPRAPASTTKMMTALVALEQGNLESIVTVSPSAAATPGSSAHLRVGERYTLSALLHGLLLRSGNDAAVAIAQHIAGSVPAFAVLMNERARALGLVSTNFVNPHGLTESFHFSSAYDLALIARAALGIPTFAAIVDSPTGIMQGEDAHLRIIRKELANTNRLLVQYDWVDGVKTGTTNAAGSCLVASGTLGGMKLIAVVLHSDDRWADSLRLLQWGFSHFSDFPPYRAGTLLRTVTIAKTDETLPVVTASPLAVPLALDEWYRARTAVRIDALKAPISRGTVVGDVAIRLNGQVLAEVPLVAGRTVRAQPWWIRSWWWVARRI